MSKIVVTGCCGLLGQKLVNSLRRHSVVGIDLLDSYPDRDLKFEYRSADITDRNSLERALHERKPEWLINCAGVTNVDACEKNNALAYMVNVSGVEKLVELCSEMKIKIVQMSTDYVFDGRDGPYGEDAQPNPVGYYGLTKHYAEKLIMEGLRDYVIIRTNVLYGTGVDIRPNFLSWALNRLQGGKSLSVVTDQFNNPTLAENLAEAIAELIDLDFQGVMHFGGRDYISRFKFAESIAQVFALDANLIRPVLTEELHQVALRPLQGGVQIGLARKLLKTIPLSVNEGLEIVKRQLIPQPSNQF